MPITNHSFLKTAATVMSTLIAATLFYFTFMDRHDEGVAGGAAMEMRVTHLEEGHEHMQQDIRDIRIWVKDLHNVLVRGEAAPIRNTDHSD